MQSKINGMVYQLYLNQAVQSEKIKLPEKPKSFISEGNLSDKNIVKHSSTSEAKKFDICNKSPMIQEKHITRVCVCV